MNILLVTIGFDEKFQIRALMRRFKEIDKVVIVGYFNEERAKKALESFINVINTAGVSYELLEVNPYSFDDLIVRISKFINKNKGNRLIVNLSGGMRILILGVILSFIINYVDAEIEVETEDFKTVVSIRLKDLMPISLSNDHINILKAIKEGYVSINSLHSYLKIPLSTVWRRVKELISEGLLTEDLQLTYRGKLLLKIYESNFSMD
ncbi:CRISPR associated DNA-binding protein, Csa3 [Acidianus hospitalis W1]|uniref:CRISPR associated DNA-binding protein, Csa3 n=1 Tax=Acidianus hospitalis (strain W1) TaxID=933801 RepID=F4B6T1_ACIHW|nr:CRISPR-associated CARF protein Csa3 [Acidianus hospitalis]AEE94624.1 CRISPR associated DNA-binding protein, Csa3 [Acidianus hospitalis W1]